jgi:hypothetical protein
MKARGTPSQNVAMPAHERKYITKQRLEIFFVASATRGKVLKIKKGDVAIALHFSSSVNSVLSISVPDSILPITSL